MQVYKLVPALQRRQREPDGFSPLELEPSTPESQTQTVVLSKTHTLLHPLKGACHRVLPVSYVPLWFRHRALLPSLSLALLYLTVLSFSGQMITFLIAIGYNSLHIGAARTVSSIFELSATWIAPKLIKKVGPVRGGIWSLNWQIIWLAAGVSGFFADWSGSRSSSILGASALVGGVILSRVGLWCFDLSAQNIIQDVSVTR